MVIISKVCKKCLIEKEINKFYNNLTYKNGKSNTCVDCVKLKNKKIASDNNLCEEFFNSKIIKTNDYNDKLTVTNLYINYKKYVSDNKYKCIIGQKTFKSIMLKENYLGEQKGSTWIGFKSL